MHRPAKKVASESEFPQPSHGLGLIVVERSGFGQFKLQV
jgi:hypothetical protein